MISIVILTHNRLESLKRCIKSIEENTTVDHEIIVVDNASNDGTTQWLIDEEVMRNVHGINFKTILNPTNEGVCARNKGFSVANGEYICQADDDTILHKGWDTTALRYFYEGDNVGIVGVQGGLMKSWYEYDVYKYNNTYADFVTGYFFVMKNIGVMFDTAFGKFWREDDDLSFQFKSLGYKIRIMPMLCTHVSQRTGDIDWTLHDGNTDYVKNKWKDKQEILRLGGN